MFEDIEKLLSNVKFTCHNCGRKSGCQRLAGDRDEVKRISRNPNERPEIQVYCEHCGKSNTINITETNVADILSSFLR